MRPIIVSVSNDNHELTKATLATLRELAADGLVTLFKENVVVSDLGKQFVPVVCSAFDFYLQQNVPAHDASPFSRAV